MPSIETERLRLRIVCRDDLDDLAKLFADPDVVKYVGDGKPASREDAAKAVESMIAHWQKHLCQSVHDVRCIRKHKYRGPMHDRAFLLHH